IAADAVDAVDGGDPLMPTVAVSQQFLRKQCSVAEVAADLARVVGPARQEDAASRREHDRALLADVETGVEAGEVEAVDGGDDDAGEAAVRVVAELADGQDPVTVGS